MADWSVPLSFNPPSAVKNISFRLKPLSGLSRIFWWPLAHFGQLKLDSQWKRRVEWQANIEQVTPNNFDAWIAALAESVWTVTVSPHFTPFQLRGLIRPGIATRRRSPDSRSACPPASCRFSGRRQTRPSWGRVWTFIDVVRSQPRSTSKAAVTTNTWSPRPESTSGSTWNWCLKPIPPCAPQPAEASELEVWATSLAEAQAGDERARVRRHPMSGRGLLVRSIVRLESEVAVWAPANHTPYQLGERSKSYVYETISKISQATAWSHAGLARFDQLLRPAPARPFDGRGQRRPELIRAGSWGDHLRRHQWK